MSAFLFKTKDPRARMTVIKDDARYATVMNPEPGRERISEPMMSEFRMSLSKMSNIL